MKPQKRFNIPQSVNDLTVLVVLIEKIKPKLIGVTFCCKINDVNVHVDPLMERKSFILVRQGPDYDNQGNIIAQRGIRVVALIVGHELEEVTTDSYILQRLANVIYDN